MRLVVCRVPWNERETKSQDMTLERALSTSHLLRRSLDTKVESPIGVSPLGGCGSRDLVPDLAALGHGLARCGDGEKVAARSAVLRSRSRRSEEPLGMTH